MRPIASGSCVACLVAAAVAIGLAATNDLRLIEAVSAGNAERVRALLAENASDVNARQGDGATALHWAVHLDDADVVETIDRRRRHAPTSPTTQG